MYDNTGTGLQKASHERMLNNQGRKMVRERVGDQVNSYDHYKNMREEEGEHFDQQWGQAAGRLGLATNTANNRLGYGGALGGGFNGGAANHHQRSANAIHYDEDRRGAYVDPYQRGDNQPVSYKR